MTITKLKVYKDNKLHKYNKIYDFSPSSNTLILDFNNTKDPAKGFWLHIDKNMSDKPIFKTLKKEIEFYWKGKWSTNFKKDKDTDCECFKVETFHFKLVFEKENDYKKVVDFFTTEAKAQKRITKRKVKGKKSKNKSGGGRRIKKRNKTKNKNDTSDCDKVQKYLKKTKSNNWFRPIYGVPQEKNKIKEYNDYNVLEDESTKLPKGYKKVEKTKIDNHYIEEYICGNKIQPVKSIVEENKKNYDCYLIHDNGGRPFAVYISPNKKSVSIYRYPKNFLPSDDDVFQKSYIEYYSELIKKYKCKDVFVGESPKNDMTKFSGGYGKKFKGNSILIKLSDKKYVFVGEVIYEFNSLNKIVEYTSPVGNSDVPYPYAIDEENNYYLMLEHTLFKSDKKDWDISPYDIVWNVELMTTDLSFIPPKEPIHPNFQGINRFFIMENGKKERYTLRHTSEPSKEYDRLKKDIGKPLIIEYTDGTEKEISKNNFVKLMKNFGELINIQPFEIKEIHKRI